MSSFLPASKIFENYGVRAGTRRRSALAVYSESCSRAQAVLVSRRLYGIWFAAAADALGAMTSNQVRNAVGN